MLRHEKGGVCEEMHTVPAGVSGFKLLSCDGDKLVPPQSPLPNDGVGLPGSSISGKKICFLMVPCCLPSSLAPRLQEPGRVSS